MGEFKDKYDMGPDTKREKIDLQIKIHSVMLQQLCKLCTIITTIL